MIKCMDNQVVPAELEDLLLKEHDGISEVVIIGIPHPDYGEAPAAVVVIKETHKEPGVVTAAQIKEIISSENFWLSVLSVQRLLSVTL